jgi:hypothetical protein
VKYPCQTAPIQKYKDKKMNIIRFAMFPLRLYYCIGIWGKLSPEVRLLLGRFFVFK